MNGQGEVPAPLVFRIAACGRYRVAGTQRLLAIAMAFSFAGNSGNGKADALGVVVLADGAKLGSQAASEGTTIYDGDRLSTGAEGSLRLLVGEAFVYLPQNSCVTVHKRAGEALQEFEAELVSGTAVLSVAAGSAAEIIASSARIRSIGETRGVVEVGVVGPHELMVFARRGPAQISYHGETETIAEGKSYRVLLNTSDDKVSGGQGAKKSGKRNKALLLIAIGGAAGAGVALLWRSMDRGASASPGVESPDRP